MFGFSIKYFPRDIKDCKKKRIEKQKEKQNN